LDLCQLPDTDENMRCEAKKCMVLGSATNCAKDEEIWEKYKISIPDELNCMTGRYCIMEQVKEHTMREQMSFPVSDLATVLLSDSFKNYTDLRNELFVKKGSHWEVGLSRKSTGVHMKPDGKIGFMYMTFNTTFDSVPTSADAQAIFDNWEAIVEKQVAGTGAIQFSSMYDFMRLQQELLSAAIFGISSSLLVAFVALIFVTYNWRIALIGFINIALILAIFLGTIPILGWELGLYECIFLIMTVGLSVDYTVHLLHSYNHSCGQTREEKVRQSLQSMGITVISGAITTLFAALPLFWCYLRFFQQYGVFVFFTILISIFCAVFLLSPVLLVVGPLGDDGDLDFLYALSNMLNGRTAPASTKVTELESVTI